MADLYDSTITAYEAHQKALAVARDPLGLGFPVTADPRNVASQTNVANANRIQYQRIIGGGLVSKLRIYVAVQSGNIAVAIYKNTGAGLAALPGARLATSGSVACPAVGQADVSLGGVYKVTNGDYWFAITADNTTAQFGALSNNGWNVEGFQAYQDTAFPPPATAAPTVAGNRPLVLIGVP